MDLSHRIADKKGFQGIFTFFYEITYPFTLIIPLLLLVFSFISVVPFFGEGYKIGTFSSAVFPYLASFFATITKIPSPILLSGLVLIGYIFFAIFSYQLIVLLTQRHLPGIIAALLMLVPITIISNEVPSRLSFALKNQDGAHLVALSVVPLACIFFLQFLRTGKKRLLLPLIGILLFISLTSFFTQFITIVFFVVMTVSEALISQSMSKLLRLGAAIVFYLALIVIIYNISLVRIFFSETGAQTLNVMVNVFPLSFFLIPVLGTVAFLIFDRRPSLQPLFIAVTLGVIFYVLKTVGDSLGVSLGINGDRYEGEFSFASSFLVGIIVMWIFDGIRAGDLLKRMPILLSKREYIAIGLIGGIIMLLSSALLFIPRSIV